MPDFERRSSASFISSKEGGTQDSFRRSLMNRRSSYCLRVSISTNPQFAFPRLDGVVRFRDSNSKAPESETPKSETPICRYQSSKQSMNGHYMFHMCSATT